MIDWILIIKFFSLKDEVNKPEDESNKFDKFYEIFVKFDINILEQYNT